jgi:hypothetical protein
MPRGAHVVSSIVRAGPVAVSVFGIQTCFDRLRERTGAGAEAGVRRWYIATNVVLPASLRFSPELPS